ncbi:MAG: O-antigen ligase family protein [Phycisphaerales bacterium]|nr:O-antigen ligase family protein [Phycisphaerales bacterium]
MRVARHDGGARVSLAAALLLSVLFGSFLLISPPSGQSYIGAIDWSPTSMLHRFVRLMSLGETLHTARGTEVKDIVAQFGAALLVLALAARSMRFDLIGFWRDATDRNAAWAQLFLLLWVGLSFASATWDAQPDIALGQSALYLLGLMLAVSIGGLLRQREIHVALWGYVTIAAFSAGLCIWYFYERNPYHRPGFPIGNPNTMAASIVPATIICISIIARSIWDMLRRRKRPHVAAIGAALIALALLLWCLTLTNSRGALLGLGVGSVVLVLLLAGSRVRVLVALGGLAMLIAASIWVYSHSGDMAMGRGASVRARFYYWRYAVLLWEQRPLLGHGAGAYARLANQYSLRDRALDPAAFADADWTAHAHNELFEIFVDIGLVGGVTFVAGLLATFFAVMGLIRRRPPPAIRWLIAAIGAGVAALAADSLVSPGLRLAVVPTVMWMLIGLVWAYCRERAEHDAHERQALGAGPVGSPDAAKSRGLALAIAAVALACFGIAWLNTTGVVAEYAAMTHDQRDDSTTDAAGAFSSANAIAQRRLIDPVRRLFADERALRYAFENTLRRFLTRTSQGTSGEVSSRPDPQSLARNCESLYQSALKLDERAPTLGRTLPIAARAAEMLSVLNGPTSEAAALEWRNRAEAAWRNQRLRYLTDEEALLSLAMNYPGSLTMRISYLRDALRNGLAGDAWFTAYERLSSLAGFDDDLARFAHAVGPIDPRTDADSILLSFAPEAYRLFAMRAARRGEISAALAATQRSIDLYTAVQARFPLLASVALAELADYALLQSPADTTAAASNLRRAIELLPAIQKQQRDLLAQPYRLRLVAVLALAGEPGKAREELAQPGETAINQLIADGCVASAERLSRISGGQAEAADALRRIADSVSRGE